MIIKMSDYDSDLLTHWFKDIGNEMESYKEPILEMEIVKFLKQICDIFEQNTHVFILAVEVTENYIRAKNQLNVKIADPLLAAVTIIFICHKCEGAAETLKLKHVIDVLLHISLQYYDFSDVTAMEGDILVTLSGKLPITTKVDDLNIVVEKYLRESHLRVQIRPLCLKILECLYIERKQWFDKLKNIYNQNQDCLNVFRSLICSKFYIPISILISALQLTKYRNILDVEAILADITHHTRIHRDHLSISVAFIIDIVNN